MQFTALWMPTAFKNVCEWEMIIVIVMMFVLFVTKKEVVMSKDTGGQAFPHSEQFNIGNGVYETRIKGGMTLRDYFAGQVLRDYFLTDNSVTSEQIAEECYQIADAMLKERSK